MVSVIFSRNNLYNRFYFSKNTVCSDCFLLVLQAAPSAIIRIFLLLSIFRISDATLEFPFAEMQEMLNFSK